MPPTELNIHEEFEIRKPSGELLDYRTFREFINERFVRATATEPEHDSFGEMVFYCKNHQCDARETTVRVKDRKLESVRNKMKCPLCGKGMDFHAYSRMVSLVPLGAIHSWTA